MSEDVVVVSVEGPVATVRLNRPKQLNVLDVAMGEGLVAAMSDLSANKKVRGCRSGRRRPVVHGGRRSSPCSIRT